MVNTVSLAIQLAEEATGTGIDTTAIVDGMTNGVDSMLTNFIGMLGDMLPVALPILGVTLGIGFCIGLIRRFM